MTATATGSVSDQSGSLGDSSGGSTGLISGDSSTSREGDTTSTSASTGTRCENDCALGDPIDCSTESSQTQCVRGVDGCLELQQSDCREGFVCVASTGCQEVLAASCAEVLAAMPGTPDGPQTIDPDGIGGEPPVETLCDMTTNGGGWTLVAANDETTTFVEFDRDWAEYRDGFGDLADGLGWLGNEQLHHLTSGGLALEVRHDQGLHVYTAFSVAEEAEFYTLSVTGTAASNDAGRFEGFHDGLPFTTRDMDNDTQGFNCGEEFRAGWWYADCLAMSLASGRDGDFVYWRTPADGPLQVDWIEMWVR